MALISKNHLSLTLQSLKTLLSLELNKKLGKEDRYTDEEILELLSETVNLTPVAENGKLLVEGEAYLVV
jgi:hypothetical protein